MRIQPGDTTQLRQTILGKLAIRVFGIAPQIASGPGKGLRFDPGPAATTCVTGEYERPVQQAICSMLRTGEVFYDVGANVGFFTLLSGRLVGSTGAVYAFEPVPANAARIRRNASLNRFSHIQVLNIAVSDQVGKGELLLARHVGGSVLKNAGVPPDLIGNLTVDTSSIDALVERGIIRKPNLVKVDVEGAELSVLHGMTEVLRAARPRLLIELDDAVLEKCEGKLNACRTFLERLNYTCDLLPNWYAKQEWFVRHLVAVPLSLPTPSRIWPRGDGPQAN